MCRVKNESVNACFVKSLSTDKNIIGNTESSSTEKSVLTVTGGVWLLNSFFDVLDCYKTCEFTVIVDERKLFNL